MRDNLVATATALLNTMKTNRYTLGLNYYFYESLALRLAYEINDELSVPERSDNGFLALLTWGF